MSSASGSKPQPAVFLSYAREDAGAARRFATALRAAGVEVWFDENELRGGDAWDRAIRKQIRDCALFMPVISANTQARPEGYFRLEWHLAEQRSLLITKERPFIVPVCLDETRERDAFVPDTFLAVQWTRLPGGESRPEFVERMKKLLAGEDVGRGRRTPPSGSAAGFGDPALQDTQPSIPDYELVRQIGRGSYGDVWLARGATGIWRAIKIVWRERFADAEPFEREWRGLKEFAAISLGESSQMALLHVGRNDAAGFFYYVMELADDAERGRQIDPASYVPLTFTALRARRGRLPADECVRYGVELARVLAGLHGRGLVHRDIKPSNIILVAGVPKLADIGLVAPTASARTFVGTDGFVPPEGPGSPGADVYALGKVLYELSTGLDRQEFPQLPPELNRLPDHRALLALNEVVLRACDPLPEKRYRDGAALLADLPALQAGRPVWRFARWQLVTAAAVLAVVLAGVATWKWPRFPAATSVKSIAVLPIVSSDPANADLSDGLHEQIMSTLGWIPDFRVIPNTTVSGYAGTKKTSPQIGRELSADYLVACKVRREADMIRVTGELIDTRADRQMRPLNFTKKFNKMSELQAELAVMIARELQVALSPGTKKLIARRPTENSEAYEAFLNGRGLRNNGNFNREKMEVVEELFQRAVKLDENFVEAWAELAVVHSLFAFHYGDNTPERRAKARDAMDRAAQRAPDAPEVLRAQASLSYYLLRDYAGAAAQFEALCAKWPNDAASYWLLGSVQRRSYNWAGALANLRRATELDLANLTYSTSFEGVLRQLRRWEELWAEVRRIAPFRPGGAEAAERRILRLKASADESRAEIDACLARLPPAVRETPGILHMRRDRARERGDLAEFRRLDQQLEKIGDSDLEPNSDLVLFFAPAFGYAQLDGLPAAQKRLGREPQEQRGFVADFPDKTLGLLLLSLIEALEGKRKDALEHGEKAVKLESDPLYGPGYRRMFAVVRAWCGEEEDALADLRELAMKPEGVIAAGDLKHLAFWHPLRSNPRFSARFNAIIDLVKKNTPLPLTNAAGARPAAPPR